MQRRLPTIPNMSTVKLESPISITLFNNRNSSQICGVTKITDKLELYTVENSIKDWIDSEYSRWSHADKQYTDSLKIHCTNNGEYVQLDIMVLRYGSLSHIGKVILDIVHSYNGSHKRIEFKFKYQIDEEDKKRIVLIATQILNIMSTSKFDTCSDAIHLLF